jgi:hypothetical protein
VLLGIAAGLVADYIGMADLQVAAVAVLTALGLGLISGR